MMRSAPTFFCRSGSLRGKGNQSVTLKFSYHLRLDYAHRYTHFYSLSTFNTFKMDTLKVWNSQPTFVFAVEMRDGEENQ